MRQDGRAGHIEDYLVTVRTGQWFGWSDSKNKIYSNLIVHDGGSKPTESEVNAGLAAMQDAWDAQEYARKRANAALDAAAQRRKAIAASREEAEAKKQEKEDIAKAAIAEREKQKSANDKKRMAKERAQRDAMKEG